MQNELKTGLERGRKLSAKCKARDYKHFATKGTILFHYAIIQVISDAWNKLIEIQDTILPIGVREWTL